MKTYIKPIIITALLIAFSSNDSFAQIISQTPRPEIPQSEDENLATIKQTRQTARSGKTIKTLRPGALLFAGFDTNNDYKIDKSEIKAGIEAAFSFADKNKDGKLSLVELESWRRLALGSEHASPTNYDFAPNFARSVSKKKFTEVLQNTANRLDKNKDDKKDGIIFMHDLLKTVHMPRAKKFNNCADEIRKARRQAEQQCRARRRY